MNALVASAHKSFHEMADQPGALLWHSWEPDGARSRLREVTAEEIRAFAGLISQLPQSAANSTEDAQARVQVWLIALAGTPIFWLERAVKEALQSDAQWAPTPGQLRQSAFAKAKWDMEKLGAHDGKAQETTLTNDDGEVYDRPAQEVIDRVVDGWTAQRKAQKTAAEEAKQGAAPLSPEQSMAETQERIHGLFVGGYQPTGSLLKSSRVRAGE